MADSGWDLSAEAWISSVGESGDWMRQHVLDPALQAHLRGRHFPRALDVGCGEGRMCRILRGMGIEAVTGIDPTVGLVEQARIRDPQGEYLIGCAENLPFADASYELVLTCFSLVDIADYRAAIAEMARVMAPGGSLLIANLNAFATVPTLGEENDRWVYDESGNRHHFKFDRYLDEAASDERWSGISIVNHHRPLSAYMQALLGHGLRLTHFDEPAPVSGDPGKVAKYRRVPYALVMEWVKPEAG